MAHEIFGGRIVSYRKKCWHSLGLVTETEMTAREALTAIDGDIRVELRPMFTEIESHLVALPNRQIVRYPTLDDPEHILLGTVGPQYELLTPQIMVDVWDASVNRPIETMALLRRGALFFATTKLPEIDVRGDEVQRFLMVVSPMDGVRALQAIESPVRTVCMNTLRAAQAQAHVNYRVLHDGTARERIGAWLKDAVRKAEDNHAVMKETFEILAGKRVTEPDAKDILVATYPHPKMPRDNAPADVMARRYALLERERPRVDKRREQALELFQGAGTGMDSRAAKGTAWGIFNAITEAENHRRTRKNSAEDEARIGEAILFGDRAETMQRGFDACLAFATDKSLHAVQRQHKAHLN